MPPSVNSPVAMMLAVMLPSPVLVEVNMSVKCSAPRCDAGADGWAEATAMPVLLTAMAARTMAASLAGARRMCDPFRS